MIDAVDNRILKLIGRGAKYAEEIGRDAGLTTEQTEERLYALRNHGRLVISGGAYFLPRREDDPEDSEHDS